VSAEPPPTIDSANYRRVLGHFPTGVVVITAVHDDEPVGLAIGSFTSASLDPPLVGFLPDKSSSTWPRIEASGAFCVNVLGDAQQDVCRAMATKGPDKFAAVTWRHGRTGAPVIDGALAYIDCEIEVVHEVGDHWFVVGRVVDLDVIGDGGPLLFFRGGYGGFSGR
jgi:flavin reductase (DIM6/NTAB) family NADH-FMN oxidoreductase RutF